MDVKGQLKNAQVELKEFTDDTTNPAGSKSGVLQDDPTKFGSMKYSMSEKKMYVANGTSWKKLLEKEDQFKDFPLGSIQASMMREQEFQALMGEMRNLGTSDTTWILCDGRDVSGSDWANYITNISGFAVGDLNHPYREFISNFPTAVYAPDGRGVVLKGKANGRTSPTSFSEMNLGFYHGDTIPAHTHTVPSFTLPQHDSTFGTGGFGVTSVGTPNGNYTFASKTTSSVGSGSENLIRSFIGNYFIKINRTIL